METPDYLQIPYHLRDGMRRYLEDGILPGSFLTACLENDFVEATVRASGSSAQYLKEIAQFIYNEIPEPAWGSKSKMEKWMADKRKERKEGESGTET